MQKTKQNKSGHQKAHQVNACHDDLYAITARYEAVLAAIPDIVMETDQNKVYVWANAAGIEFFGDDVIGKEPAYFFVGEQDTYNLVDPLFQGNEKVVYVESWQRRKDGQERLLAWWCRVMKNANGNVTGVLSTARDITDQYRAQIKLRESEDRIRKIMEVAPDAFYVTDINGTILDGNAAAEKIVGYKREALIGKNIFEANLLRPEDTTRIEALMAQEASGKPTGPDIFVIHRGDGAMITVELRGTPTIINNEEVVVCSMRDISEQKRLEQDLLDSNSQLNEALNNLRETQDQMLHNARLSALGQMAGGIAHDFNNILMPIVGLSNYLSSYSHALDNKEEALSMLKQIERAANDARNIVHNLRLIYKPTAIEPFERIDADALVTSALDMTSPKWKEERQAIGKPINTKLVATANRTLMGNETALRQALVNLILNAIDAMPESGTLTVSSRSDNEHVLLEITDTGIGMTEDCKIKCLEPFFSDKGVKGTGIGLAMVNIVVKQHNGTIEIDSESGKGTTVRIRLPADSKNKLPEAKPHLRQSKPASSRLRILVIDDEYLSCSLLSRLLRIDSHSVETASSGKEGIEKFKDDDFHLVFTDRSMPDMHGDDVAGIIKKLRPDVPIIMLTGFGDIMNEKGELPVSVDKVACKPVTLQDLRGLIAETIKSL
ncbi:MAG: PAS domain S-box protein [Lentisphaerae bacterium]|nr:PAS domain S-box protein [Lentisphaerota bacterium]